MNSQTGNPHERTLQRAGVYAWLARVWGREISSDWLPHLRAEPFCGLLSDAVDSLATENEQQRLEEWAVDFCLIMIGPKSHAAPIQSVWTDGKIAGRVTDQMIEMQQVIQPTHEYVANIPDHFANQLQLFSQILLRDHALQSQSSSAEDLAACHQLAGHFFTDHLQWAKPMLRKAAALAQSSFYQSVIQMTQSWLDDEATHYHPPIVHPLLATT